MKEKFKMLVLTDHSRHTASNSIYPLLTTFVKHSICECIDVVSKGDKRNDIFFNTCIKSALIGVGVNDQFIFNLNGQAFLTDKKKVDVRDYDVILLRMPPPLCNNFLSFLSREFPNQLFINDPLGINETGSKEYLLNFKSLCPPMKKCTKLAEIEKFKNQHPAIVLKPFYEYGGRGILKISGDNVWDNNQAYEYSQFVKNYKNNKKDYLAVKYLKNVQLGDKRIIIINGKIVGASLRLPSANSWICNVSMGGTFRHADVEEEEIQIAREVNSLISKKGIVMYGIDTLMEDNGKRVLSEINTTSIGGFPQLKEVQKAHMLEETSTLIWNYILNNQKLLVNGVNK